MDMDATSGDVEHATFWFDDGSVITSQGENALQSSQISHRSVIKHILRARRHRRGQVSSLFVYLIRLDIQMKHREFWKP